MDGEWVEVADAAELAPAQVVDAAVGDRDLVVWRTAGGEACVMEARCPHEWSHLGAEGVVDGDEIVCTAHWWRFAPDGTGTKLNVKGRRDRKADIEVFECRERAGRVEAWVPGATPGTSAG
ncbi:MAG: Rieske (2Fe-2S) protein [Acidimicrobiales bacterium]|nr:Rieske (2Fe-2S) protein [Acidimicrobiales bacterium]